MEQEINKKEIGQVFVTGIGHLGWTELYKNLASTCSELGVGLVICDLNELPLSRIKDNPQILYIFVDVNCLNGDPNRTIRERLLEIKPIESVNVESFLFDVTEKRKRKKEFSHIINDDGYLQNSLLLIRATIRVFFKIPPPVP